MARGKKRSPKASKKTFAGRPAWMRETTPIEMYLGEEVEVRRIQPYRAAKNYTCPRCNTTIPIGLGHVVIVPVASADDRRHWHQTCWKNRDTRR